MHKPNPATNPPKISSLSSLLKHRLISGGHFSVANNGKLIFSYWQEITRLIEERNLVEAIRACHDACLKFKPKIPINKEQIDNDYHQLLNAYITDTFNTSYQYIEFLRLEQRLISILIEQSNYETLIKLILEDNDLAISEFIKICFLQTFTDDANNLLSELLAIINNMSQSQDNTKLNPLKTILYACKGEVTKSMVCLPQYTESFSSSEAYMYITTLLLLCAYCGSPSESHISGEHAEKLNKMLNTIKQIIDCKLKNCYRNALIIGESWAISLAVNHSSSSDGQRPPANTALEDLFLFLHQDDPSTITRRSLLSGLIIGRPTLSILAEDFFTNHARIEIPRGNVLSGIIDQVLTTPVDLWPEWLSDQLTQDETNILIGLARLGKGKTGTLKLMQRVEDIFNHSNTLGNPQPRR